MYCAPYANVLRHCQIPNVRVLQELDLNRMIEVNRSELPDDLKDLLFEHGTGEGLGYIGLIHEHFLEDMKTEEINCNKRRATKKNENDCE